MEDPVGCLVSTRASASRKGQTCMGSTKAAAVIATVSCHACNHNTIGKGRRSVSSVCKECDLIWFPPYHWECDLRWCKSTFKLVLNLLTSNDVEFWCIEQNHVKSFRKYNTTRFTKHKLWTSQFSMIRLRLSPTYEATALQILDNLSHCSDILWHILAEGPNSPRASAPQKAARPPHRSCHLVSSAQKNHTTRPKVLQARRKWTSAKCKEKSWIV